MKAWTLAAVSGDYKAAKALMAECLTAWIYEDALTGSDAWLAADVAPESSR